MTFEKMQSKHPKRKREQGFKDERKEARKQKRKFQEEEEDV